MKILTYFKQAWQLLRQNKLFSTIYIVGTALAIASTTIFAIIYYVKLAPVYPETNRSRMSVILTAMLDEEDCSWSGALSLASINHYLRDLPHADVISVYRQTWQTVPVNLNDDREEIKIVLRPTDTAFFKIFDYEFLAGAPFSDTDFNSGVKKAVITDRLAEEVFGSVDAAMGNTITINFKKYDVCGVIREGSAINKHSYAQAIVPYSTMNDYAGDNDTEQFIGYYYMLLLSDDLAGLQSDLSEVSRKYNSTHNGKTLSYWNQPQSATLDALGIWPSDDDFDLGKTIRFNALVLLTLLLVPALNLSGMIAGRMDSRSSELGVRKSFGATRNRLLGQVLWENLFLTVVGGILGLIITWIVLSTDATFVFSIIGDEWLNVDASQTIRLTPDMMFAPAVFVFAFGVCVVLNILSALLPAWLSLRNPIVKSLK